MNITDNFNTGTVFNTSLWESAVLNTGASVYISGGAAYIKQNSGWSGGYLRTKQPMTVADIKSHFVAEFDIQVVGAYHVGGAGVNPCFGFTSSNSTREMTYYYSSTNNNLVFQLDSNAAISFGARDGGDINTTTYASLSGLNLGVLTHIKIEIINSIMKVYINNSITASMIYTITTAQFSRLYASDVRWEWYLGNYSSGQYMLIDNATVTTTTTIFLLQDGSSLDNSTDGTTLTVVGSTPVVKVMFDTYGMKDLTKITSTSISKITSPTYKINMQKK